MVRERESMVGGGREHGGERERCHEEGGEEKKRSFLGLSVQGFGLFFLFKKTTYLNLLETDSNFVSLTLVELDHKCLGWSTPSQKLKHNNDFSGFYILPPLKKVSSSKLHMHLVKEIN